MNQRMKRRTSLCEAQQRMWVKVSHSSAENELTWTVRRGPAVLPDEELTETPFEEILEALGNVARLKRGSAYLEIDKTLVKQCRFESFGNRSTTYRRRLDGQDESEIPTTKEECWVSVEHRYSRLQRVIPTHTISRALCGETASKYLFKILKVTKLLSFVGGIAILCISGLTVYLYSSGVQAAVGDKISLVYTSAALFCFSTVFLTFLLCHYGLFMRLAGSFDAWYIMLAGCSTGFLLFLQSGNAGAFFFTVFSSLGFMFAIFDSIHPSVQNNPFTRLFVPITLLNSVLAMQKMVSDPENGSISLTDHDINLPVGYKYPMKMSSMLTFSSFAMNAFAWKYAYSLISKPGRCLLLKGKLAVEREKPTVARVESETPSKLDVLGDIPRYWFPERRVSSIRRSKSVMIFMIDPEQKKITLSPARKEGLVDFEVDSSSACTEFFECFTIQELKEVERFQVEVFKTTTLDRSLQSAKKSGSEFMLFTSGNFRNPWPVYKDDHLGNVFLGLNKVDFLLSFLKRTKFILRLSPMMAVSHIFVFMELFNKQYRETTPIAVHNTVGILFILFASIHVVFGVIFMNLSILKILMREFDAILVCIMVVFSYFPLILLFQDAKRRLYIVVSFMHAFVNLPLSDASHIPTRLSRNSMYLTLAEFLIPLGWSICLTFYSGELAEPLHPQPIEVLPFAWGKLYLIHFSLTKFFWLTLFAGRYAVLQFRFPGRLGLLRARLRLAKAPENY